MNDRKNESTASNEKRSSNVWIYCSNLTFPQDEGRWRTRLEGVLLEWRIMADVILLSGDVRRRLKLQRSPINKSDKTYCRGIPFHSPFGERHPTACFSLNLVVTVKKPTRRYASSANEI